MSDLWTEIAAWFTAARAETAVRVLIILVVGWMLARFLASVAGRVAAARSSAHQVALIKRLVRYVLITLVVLTAISELGFDLGVLLGAAGLLTVAIGFAAQASTSNIISGVFLIGEGAFSIGDTIMVGQTTGEVLAIDLLSVKLRTFDNLYVRVPNETLLKNEIRNFSRFPIRRLDIPLAIPFDVDFAEVKRLLTEVAARNVDCLDEPSPQVVFLDVTDRGYIVQYSVWVARERFLAVRGSVHAEVVAALDARGIGIPMPRYTVFANATESAAAATQGVPPPPAPP